MIFTIALNIWKEDGNTEYMRTAINYKKIINKIIKEGCFFPINIIFLINNLPSHLDKIHKNLIKIYMILWFFCCLI